MSDHEDYEKAAREHNMMLEGYQHLTPLEELLPSRDEIEVEKRAMAFAPELLDHLIIMVRAHERDIAGCPPSSLLALRDTMKSTITLIERVTGQKWE